MDGVGAAPNDEPTASQGHKPKGWIGDFAWRDGHILIRKTGISLRLDRHVLNEIFQWAIYLVVLSLVYLATRLNGKARPKLWFAPDRPHPWYWMRGAAMWAGLDMAKTAQDADAAVYFDDSTSGTPPAGLRGRSLNHGCTDISKSHVATVFEDVFGYKLTVDPSVTVGEIVEKPETNGVHGGRIVMAPRQAAPRLCVSTACRYT